MKYFLLFFLILATTFFSSVFGQINSVDSLVRKAFAAIKSNDEQAYIGLFPNYPQTKTFFASLLNSIQDSTMKKSLGEKMNTLTEEVYNKELKQKFIGAFKDFVLQGSKIGIDWSKATLDSFNSKEELAPGVNIRTLGGNIFFTSDGKQYTIPFSDAIWSKTDERWFGFEMKKIKKNGEDNDSEDVELIDKKIPPPPPPKKAAAKKSVTKKPVAKTKPAPKLKTKS